jgi:subtilisin family serine protease
MQLLLLISQLLISSYATEKVVIIDTGLDIKDNRFHHLCATGHKDFTHTGMTDNHGHGTHIAGIIDKNLSDKYCIVIVKYWNMPTDKHVLETYLAALTYATSLSPKVINLSLVGEDFVLDEYSLMKQASTTQFIVSAGNTHTQFGFFTNIYPAQYKLPNITVVGALHNGVKASYSNYGDTVTKWEEGAIESFARNNGNIVMRGTSQATARYTSIFLSSNNGR